MSRFEKLFIKLMRGMSDANFSFDDLRHILTRLGFGERVHGSHHVFRRPDIPERLVIQPNGKDAKPYQVGQVRDIIERYSLGGADDGQV